MFSIKKLAVLGASVLLLASAAAPISQASSLTSSQISAIIGLLKSFGADQNVINNVSATLNGQSVTQSNQNCLTLTHNLYLDQTDTITGGEVSALQQFLGGQVTGYFGPATLALVQSWQVAHGVVSAGAFNTTSYGYVGPKTRAAIKCSNRIASTPVTTSPVVAQPAARTFTVAPAAGIVPLMVVATFPQDFQSLVTSNCANSQANFSGRGFSVNWGDGSYPQENGRNAPCATHVYSNSGIYSIVLRVYDFSDTNEFNGNFTRDVWVGTTTVTVGALIPTTTQTITPVVPVSPAINPVAPASPVTPVVPISPAINPVAPTAPASPIASVPSPNTTGAIDVVSDCGANVSSADNRAVLQRCIDRYAPTGGTLTFPSGSFNVIGTLYIRNGGIVIAGANHSSTHIVETDPAAPLFVIGKTDGTPLNEGGIHDINLIYATQRAGGTLITMDNVWRFHVTNVTFGNTAGGFSMGATGISANKGARLYIESSTFTGPTARAIYLNNTSDTYLTSDEINMADDVSVHAKGIVFDNNANGIYATSLNVTSGDTGFEFIQTDPSSVSPPSWSFFTNCLADTQKVHGWNFQNAKSITLSNSWSSSANLAGIVIGNTDGISINGSRIYNNGQEGIFVNAQAHNTQISNSRIAGNSRAGSGLSNGILVVGGASGVSIQGNVIGPADSFVGHTQAYGIAILEGKVEGLIVTNNTLTGNVNAGLLNLSTDGTQSISGNLGQ